MFSLLFIPVAAAILPIGLLFAYILEPLGMAGWLTIAKEWLDTLPAIIGEFFGDLFAT